MRGVCMECRRICHKRIEQYNFSGFMWKTIYAIFGKQTNESKKKETILIYLVYRFVVFD